MGKCFDRVVVVMLENAVRARVLQNPYMSALRRQGVFLQKAQGVTHSSQPNYILSIGGDTLTVCDDSPSYAQWIYMTPPTPPVTSIVDLLEAKGLTWKAYAEALPADYNRQNLECYQANMKQASNPAAWTFPPEPFPFARRHVPFLSFTNILTSAARSARIVNATEFSKDLQDGALPAFSWYTPNLVNDGHSLSETQARHDPQDKDHATNIDNIAAFLQGFLGPDPVARFPARTFIAVTFDEAYPYCDPYFIYTLLLGDMLEAGTERAEPYNHYSLLRSIEENFDLGTLNRNDTSARPYWFLDDRRAQ
jgi:hypothetical protein